MSATNQKPMLSRDLIEALGYSKTETNRKIREMFPEEVASGEIPATRRENGQVIDYHLNAQQASDFITRWTRFNNSYGIRERAALATIEQLLDITLERQVTIANYRVDGLHVESMTVYEIDEEQHFTGGELKLACVNRQAYLEGLGYTVKRIKV